MRELVSLYWWRPLTDPALSFQGSRDVTQRIERILQSWIGTRYMVGQQCKGVVVDCTRFVAGVFDELFGFRRCEMPKLPPDRATHDRRGAMKTFHEVKRLYDPIDRVRDYSIEPGDWVIVGPRGGGPGHALIAGTNPGEIWHCLGTGVHRTGLVIASQHTQLFGVFRFRDRHRWLRDDVPLEQLEVQAWYSRRALRTKPTTSSRSPMTSIRGPSTFA